MKIIHMCLSCFYIDNFNYQENLLPKQNAIDGHDVYIIASTETFNSKFILDYIEPRKYINEYGIPVERIPYSKILPHFIMKKIRKYSGVRESLDKIRPDVIYFHGMAAYEILTIVKYKKDNPNVKIIMDSHEDQYNSGKNLISKYFLHKGFYRIILNICKQYIDRVYCVSYESMNFVKKMYGLNNLVSYMPLGGEIIDEAEYQFLRNDFRNKHRILDSEIVFFHSGKMDKSKKTLELMRSFSSITNDSFRLFIAGSVSSDIQNEFNRLIHNDKRILYLGWINSIMLKEIMSGCDVYIQPGTQSATMQQALCFRNAVALFPYPSHDYLLKDSYIRVQSEDQLSKMFIDITNDVIDINKLKLKSFDIASEVLDYKLQSRKYITL